MAWRRQALRRVHAMDRVWGSQDRRGGPMFKNILIPTDGSEQSQRAVRTGVELAK
ncbi:MAG: universal stress protein, partial [Burkholderiales bacterium]|nr:universal stress protein [Burkholderiales bacterium]